MLSLPQRIFVTGTDTDVGKTLVAALLCLRLNASYWKPIQAGSPTDSQRIASWIGAAKVHRETFVLKHPLSPNQAAEKEALAIDPQCFELPDSPGSLVVEGAGGLLVPISREFFMIDLIQKLTLPVVLTARSGLGTLNHTLLSIEALKRRKIPIVGIVLNGDPHPDNARDLVHYGQVPILGQVPFMTEISLPSLTEGSRCFFYF